MPTQTVTAARRVLWDPSATGARQRVVRSRAPLRLGLAGGGTDVSPYCDDHGGLVLNATIDRYCYATIEDGNPGDVEIQAADIGKAMDLRWSDELPSSDEPVLPLHASVYRRICKLFDLGRPGVKLTTVSEAPPGSGLGSSSTLVVALVEAFREFFGLPMGTYDVAQMAYDVERIDCGLAGGRQDQYAATFGGFNSMEFGAGGHVIVSPLRLPAAIVRELEASMVLFQTEVSRSSAGIIERQADHIRAGAADQLAATHDIKAEAVAMRQALVRGDLGQLAQVLDRGWEVKKRLAEGITTDEIDNVFTVARGAGALAGKVSGAGGGGYLMLLCEPTRRPELLKALAGLEHGRVEPVHFVDDGAVAWTVR
jgi:D-glycero-alpha-D-manno-heptose-7-phosphate kinase